MHKNILSVFSCLVLLTAFNYSSAQIKATYNPVVTRILFVFDGSGSMKTAMGKESKYEVAKDLLSHLVDSIEKNTKNVELGLRMFGHQSPDAQKNCKDSRLEVRFAKGNAANIISKLNSTKPLGNTPIAYSLFESINDFPADQTSKNAIILITDGLEECEGNPCAVSQLMEKKRIAMKPFIIGLSIPDSLRNYFDCVGTFYDASTRSSFKNVMNVVISQAMNNTSLQVNLLDAAGMPTETNVEFTLYDAHSGEVRYNFLHTLDASGMPDTIFIDPIGKYNMVVHTIPPVEKKGIELTPGKHNIAAVDAPQGTLSLKIESDGKGYIRSIIRKANTAEILFLQDFNTDNKYIAGDYDLEILTLPRIKMNVAIPAGTIKEVKIPKAGNLTTFAAKDGNASVYVMENDRLAKIYEYKAFFDKQTLDLQPGEYYIIYRPFKEKDALLTQTVKFKINPGSITTLRF